MSEQINLISPDGKRAWSTTDRVEATNLRAQGWHTPPAADEAPAPTETIAPNQPAAVEPSKALADVPAPPADKAAPSKPSK